MAVALVLGYLFYGFANFPRTEILTTCCAKLLAPPLPMRPERREPRLNLGYLFVILLFAWIIPDRMKYLFRLPEFKLERGVVKFRQSGLIRPLYKLCEFPSCFFFVLMVSFPYLLGTNSAF